MRVYYPVKAFQLGILLYCFVYLVSHRNLCQLEHKKHCNHASTALKKGTPGPKDGSFSPLGAEIVIESNTNTTTEATTTTDSTTKNYESSSISSANVTGAFVELDTEMPHVRSKRNAGKSGHSFTQERTCISVTSDDVLGFGSEFAASRLFVMFYASATVLIATAVVVFGLVSTFLILDNPSVCSIVVRNAVQCSMVLSAAALLSLHRFNWLQNWSQVDKDFVPVYPSDWIIVEILLYTIVPLLIVEVLLNKLMFSRMYVERSMGVYQIVDQPMTQSLTSVYRTTIE